MSTTTVSKLASALKLSNEKLILQLNEAGIDVTDKSDVVSNDQKLMLLNHLRGSHGTKSTTSSAPKKLTIHRRSQSELKLSGSFGRSRTVNVEVRRKRTYLKKETLIDQAKKELEEQKKLEQEKQKQIEEEIQNQKLESAPTEITDKDQPKISVTNEKLKDTSYKKDKGKLKKSILSYANVGATSLFTTAIDLVKWLDNFRHTDVGGAALLDEMQLQGVLNNGE